MTTIGSVLTVLRGQARPLGHATSAIAKQPVEGPVAVHRLGLEGDEQADLRVHGGEDKALHAYAWPHYAVWRQELPGCPLLEAPGAFGENLSIDGLAESGTCLGDRWRLGSAIVVVSQGRQPCFKLNLRFGVDDMAARVQQSLRAGWYLRVEQPGTIAAGDAVTLLERPHPDYTITRLLALIRDRETRPDEIARVLALPLTPAWRKLFERRLVSGQVEDWSSRMKGRA